jgi:omega-amidase
MKAGFFQYDVAHLNYEANLRRLRKQIPGLDFDLLVLPELFTSGYLFENRETLLTFAKNHTLEQTVEDLRQLLKGKNRGQVLVGTIPELKGDHIYNTGVAVSAGGLLGTQRKRHLPRLEKKSFTPGEAIHPIQVQNTTIGIVTCFDAWFPELFRLLVRQGVQLICQPANFGGPWTPDIMRVRAMENRLFCIVANRIGREKTQSIEAFFRGESQVIGPDGQVLALAEDQEALSVIDIDPSAALSKGNIMCDDLAAEWERYRIEM